MPENHSVNRGYVFLKDLKHIINAH